MNDRLKIYFETLIEACRKSYIRTQNPIYIWIAYQSARDKRARNFGIGMPEWVLEYFDRVAGNVSELATGDLSGLTSKGGKSDKLARAVCRALELKASGAGHFINRFNHEQEELVRAGEVYGTLLEGYPYIHAIDKAAAGLGVSGSTVDRAWKGRGRYFENDYLQRFAGNADPNIIEAFNKCT